jgi:hypothetical protein
VLPVLLLAARALPVARQQRSASRRGSSVGDAGVGMRLQDSTCHSAEPQVRLGKRSYSHVDAVGGDDGLLCAGLQVPLGAGADSRLPVDRRVGLGSPPPLRPANKQHAAALQGGSASPRSLQVREPSLRVLAMSGSFTAPPQPQPQPAKRRAVGMGAGSLRWPVDTPAAGRPSSLQRRRSAHSGAAAGEARPAKKLLVGVKQDVGSSGPRRGLLPLPLPLPAADSSGESVMSMERPQEAELAAVALALPLGAAAQPKQHIMPARRKLRADVGAAARATAGAVPSAPVEEHDSLPGLPAEEDVSPMAEKELEALAARVYCPAGLDGSDNDLHELVQARATRGGCGLSVLISSQRTRGMPTPSSAAGAGACRTPLTALRSGTPYSELSVGHAWVQDGDEAAAFCDSLADGWMPDLGQSAATMQAPHACAKLRVVTAAAAAVAPPVAARSPPVAARLPPVVPGLDFSRILEQREDDSSCFPPYSIAATCRSQLPRYPGDSESDADSDADSASVIRSVKTGAFSALAAAAPTAAERTVGGSTATAPGPARGPAQKIHTRRPSILAGYTFKAGW